MKARLEEITAVVQSSRLLWLGIILEFMTETGSYVAARGSDDAPTAAMGRNLNEAMCGMG